MKNWQLDLILSIIGCIVLRIVVKDNYWYLVASFGYGLGLGLLKNVIGMIYRGDE